MEALHNDDIGGQKPEGQIRNLLVSRIAMATFLLAVFVFMQNYSPDFAGRVSIPYFYGITLAIYILSLFYVVLSRISPNYRMQIYLQVTTDVFLITALIYVTGGVRSTYAVFYPLVIIYAVLYLGRNGGLIAASTASICYGLLIDLEFYRIIEPLAYPSMWEIPDTAGHVFYRIFVNILSFYLIAGLASFVVEKEKRTRALLAEKESAFNKLDLLYRSIIESVDAGILTVDMEGRIKSFNRAAEKITGWSLSEVENRRLDEVFANWENILENKGTYERQIQGQIEMTITAKDGRRLVVGCLPSALRDRDDQKFGDILIFQDMTAAKQLEEVLERNRRLAFVGEMAAGLAHEIRSPLASISGAVQMLRRDGGFTATEARLMQLIMRSKDQLEGFIKDFLLLARPARGPQEVVGLMELMAEVVEAVRVTPDWNSAIKLEECFEPGLAVRGNREELRQLAWNFILNAVQAMPTGGVLKLAARRRANGNQPGVEIIVEDTGAGISEGNGQSIFEPFFTTKERGTGLGLAIVMRIVNSYGGKLSFKSALGRGSAFQVWLPGGENISGGFENGQDSRR